MKKMGKPPEEQKPQPKPTPKPAQPGPQSARHIPPSAKPAPKPSPGAAGAAHKPEWVSKKQEEAVEKAKAAAEPRVYEVKPGDSLSKIAKEVLGDAGRWKEIFEANKDQISDPNIIRVGQKLKIP